jgi:hypothetical protein
MSSTTKERLLAAGRDLTFRLCTGGGLSLGLLWGLNNWSTAPSPPKPRTCTTPTCISDGFSHTLVSSIWSVLGPALIGAGIGMAVAALIIFTLLQPRTRSTPRRSAPARAIAHMAEAPAAAKWMKARYSGRCSGCRGEIQPGDRILHSRSPRATWCAACGER